MTRLAVWITLLTGWLVTVGCEESTTSASGTPKPGPSGVTMQEGPDLATLRDQLAKLSPADRAKKAPGLCYVGKCEQSQHPALLEAAGTPEERQKLEAIVRQELARQYMRQLLEAGRKPNHVRVVGAAKNVLEVDGDLCNRFFIENFMGRPAAKAARSVGFTKIKCQNRGAVMVAPL